MCGREEGEGDRAARERQEGAALSQCKSFEVQPKQSLLKTSYRAVPWLCNLLGFALLFLLVAKQLYNAWLSWHFLSSLCKRSRASAFLHLAITAVVHNALTEKPVLIFHVSELHNAARKIFRLGLAAEGGFIFVLSAPFCGCAVCYLFHLRVLQHAERGQPAADCPSPCCHQMSSADASGVMLSLLTESVCGLRQVSMNSPELHPRGILHPERCLSSLSKGLAQWHDTPDFFHAVNSPFPTSPYVGVSVH